MEQDVKNIIAAAVGGLAVRIGGAVFALWVASQAIAAITAPFAAVNAALGG